MLAYTGRTESITSPSGLTLLSAASPVTMCAVCGVVQPPEYDGPYVPTVSPSLIATGAAFDTTPSKVLPAPSFSVNATSETSGVDI